MKILNYGSLNIDLVFSVPHISLPGETIMSFSLKKSAGGKGANQSAAIAKAGIEVFHAGKIGRDGQWLVCLLEGYGVKTNFIRITEDFSGQAIIQVDAKGQNSIVLSPGGNHQITHDEIDETLNFFTRGDILLLQNEINNVAYIMEKAHDKGMIIWFNPAPFDEAVFQYPLNTVDMFMVNEIEGAQLAVLSNDSPYRFILDTLTSRFHGKEIVLTAGSSGAFYGCGEIRQKGDIIDVPVVDTTGAGDTFIGYFLGSRVRGFTISDCLSFACKASSLKVTRHGAMEAIPLASEIYEDY